MDKTSKHNSKIIGIFIPNIKNNYGQNFEI
jgi:hypothetical protein